MIILGIDPGLAHTGFALIEIKNRQASVLSYGCIKTEVKEKMERRLNKIFIKISKLIKKYKPKKIALERLFFNKNVTSALNVGQAKGVIYLAAAKNRISVFEYTPLQIKQAITGHGRADKEQIQKMLKIILKLKDIPHPDHASDALAAAYCCFVSKEF